MKTVFGRFLRDESGAVTVDSIVVLGGLTWMLVAVVIDIGAASVALTDRVSDELEYNQVLHNILDGYGPDSTRVPPRDG
jgi:Flp pilus assembly pilin Flp